ncbi:hypothetical protein DFJ74DRAFT_745097 [Hyaloraphidium curvatum]|nr:hypothetical protein DFJ74DRAFT_745097 [Hyaloraphidium curvatum]
MVATIPGSPSPDPWGRFRWASAVAYGALVVGAAGGAVYAVFAGIQTSELYNQWIPMWAAFMVLITGLEILYTNLKTPYLFRNKGFYILDLIYWTLVAIASLIACGGWGAAQLFAPMGWFLINSFLCGLGLFLTVWRRKEVLLGVAAIASAAEANPKVVEGGAADYANGTNGINGDYANAAENGIADSTAKGASSLDKKPNCGRNTLSGFNVFLRFLHVFFLALLANGGIQAALNTSYPPRGTVQTVTLVDGRTRPLHRYCEGPASSLPTIFMDSSGAHGTVDFYPIQTYLVGLGRRVCVYDPPGFGWSGNLLANEFYYYPQSPNAANLHYDSLFEQIGEGGDKKLNFLAWGGGGNPMIRYTRLRPGKVASLGLLDVSPDGIEFKAYGAYRNYTPEQVVKYTNLQLMGRTSLANILNSLGMPWGFMSIFVPGESNSSYYVPPQYYASFRAQLRKPNAWVQQYWGIQDLKRTNPVAAVAPNVFLDSQTLQQGFLDNATPVYHIMTNITGEQVCSSSYYQQNPQLCPEAQFGNTFMFGVKTDATDALRAAPVTPVRYTYCTMDGCGLDFPVKMAQWTAQQVDATLKSFGL